MLHKLSLSRQDLPVRLSFNIDGEFRPRDGEMQGDNKAMQVVFPSSNIEAKVERVLDVFGETSIARSHDQEGA